MRMRHELRMRFNKQVIKTREKVKAWKKQKANLKKQLVALRRQHITDPSSVSSDDWNRATNGNTGKVRALFGEKFPRETWPSDIQYLNLIALANFHRAEQDKEEKVSLIPPQPVLTQEELQRQAELAEYRASIDAKIKQLLHETAQYKKQQDLLGRCMDDEFSVTLTEWEDATEGCDPDTIEPWIARRIRFARRRAAGEDIAHYWMC